MARYLIELGKTRMGQTTEEAGIPFPWTEAEVNEFLTSERFSAYAERLASHREAATSLYAAVREAVHLVQTQMGMGRIQAEEWLEDNGFISHETFLFSYDQSNAFVVLTETLKGILPPPSDLAKTLNQRDFDNLLYAVLGDVAPSYMGRMGSGGNGKMGIVVSTGTLILGAAIAVFVGIAVGYFTSGPLKELFGLYDDQTEKDLAEALAALDEVRDALARLRELYRQEVGDDPEKMATFDRTAQDAYNALDSAENSVRNAKASLSLYSRMKAWWREFGDKVLIAGGIGTAAFVGYKVVSARKK